MKTCPKCGRINEDSELKCIGCGEPLGASEKKRKKGTGQQMPPSNCPTCGQTPRTWDIYCGHCGTKLSPTQPWPNKKIGKKAVIAIAGIVVVICATTVIQKITKTVSRSNADYLAACKNEEGKWGYIDEKGNVIVDFIYDEAYAFDANGYAKVGAKQTEYMSSDTVHYGIIDATGKEVVLCQNTYIANGSDDYGYFSIERYDEIDESYINGVANIDGTVVMDAFRFTYTDNIEDSGYFIACDKDSSRYGIINSDKDWVVQPEYSYLRILADEKYEPIKVHDEYALVAEYDYGNTGIINVSNDVLLPFEYQGITYGCEKDAITARRNDDLVGAFDSELREVIPFKYSGISGFGEDGVSIATMNDNDYYIIDKEGNETYLPGIDSAYYFVKNLCPASVDGRWGVINKAGEWVIDPLFEDVSVYDKYIVGEYYEYELQDLYDHSGNWYGEFTGYNLMDLEGCEEALPVRVYGSDEFTVIKSTSSYSIPSQSYEYLDMMNGWFGLYNYGHESGCLISPSGDVVSEDYTKYFVDADSDYITAWEDYYGSTDYATHSYLLDKDGSLIRSFDNAYCVGVFKKVG